MAENNKNNISRQISNRITKVRIANMSVEEAVTADDEFSLDASQLQLVAADSSKYISNWHELISQTNWQKGQIICQWREQVCELHPEVKMVSDRAWSELTGGISPEHVGRLRRTFERFGEINDQFEGLSWTHFMIAVSWNDAEMWLEGAAQNKWTIEQMRKTRWEAMGASAADKPDPKDVIAEELTADEVASSFAEKPIQQDDSDVITGPIIEGPDWGEAESGAASSLDAPSLEIVENILKNVPDEFADSFRNMSELIKGCHSDDWKSVKRRDVLKLLNFLKDQVRNDSA